MKKYSTISLEKESQLVTLRLNRPEVHNAFNEVMMEELADAMRNLRSSDIRLIVLSAVGPNFCSGADLKWMKEGAAKEQVGIALSSEVLRQMYSQFRSFSYPIISRVRGKVFAGGVGLCAASDIVYAAEDSVFSISEARVGLIPALMSPFVVERIGIARFRELVLTGRKFNATEALDMGLVDFVIPQKGADELFNEAIQNILKGGPEALAASKALCRSLTSFDWELKSKELADMLTQRRMSHEGQEGVKAFLEKRPPIWRKTK